MCLCPGPAGWEGLPEPESWNCMGPSLDSAHQQDRAGSSSSDRRGDRTSIYEDSRHPRRLKLQRVGPEAGFLSTC